MKRLLKRTVARCGRDVTVTARDGSRQAVRALIQPVRSKSEGAMRFDGAGAGLSGPEQYVYIGPVETEIADAAFLTADGVEYLIRRAETVYFGSDAVYCWGLLTRSGGDAACSS